MSSKRSEGNTDSSIEYKYDSAGNLIEISNPLKKEDNKVLENTYDDYFRLKTQTKDNGTTYYTYNWENMPLSITTKDNSGKVLSEENYTYEYNNQGLLTTKTVEGDNTSESIVTKVQTDLIGRTIWEDNSDRPDRMRTQYTYDYMNNVTTKKVFSGSTLKLTYLYDYDHAGNILKETLQGQTNALYTYDMLGNMLSSTDANGNTTTYDYSGDGLLLKKTTPIDESTTGEIQYNYDNSGNVIEEKVKTGNNKYRSTTYTYDFNNNLATTTQGNTLISYTYNALGNVLTMKLSDTRNLTPERTTSYVYDNMGNCVRITDPMGNSEFYKYNSCNDVIEKTDRNGNKTNYTYDGLHRVIKVSVTKDGVTQVINKEYGATGGLTKEYDGTSTKSYTYNSLGLVETDTTTAANSTYTLNKTYDYMGNVSLIDYGVYKVKHDYDERGRLTTVNYLNSNTGTYIKLEEYRYDKNNNVLRKISYTGVPDVTYTYNKSDMLTSLRQGSLASYDYTYNPDGNVYTVKDNNNNLLTVYNYNNNGQLIRELKRDSETNINICYTDYDYDAAGNRIYENYSSAVGDYEIDYTYDKNNRLIKERQYSDVQENNRVTSYRYDKNGNRIGKSYYNNYPSTSPKITLKIEDYRSDLTTDAETYTYDGFNRLTQISTEGDSVYKYAYYPNGLRMYKDVNGAMTYFQWDGDNIWGLAANVSNGLTHYYYRGLDGVIKENYGAVYVYNGHGDVVKVTNSNGAVTKDYEYDAFGVIEDENAADINPFRYCGEYYDTETGNIYLRARYYDPSIGSFITEDPARDGTNWYSYCAGNPVSYIDPSGMILKILGSQQFTDDMVGYLTELTNYTFKTVAMEESEGVFVMLDGFNDNELNYVYSNQLVKGIIGNGKICTIYESYSETNQVDYANKGEYGDLEEIYAENRYNGIGMSADVYINPTNFTQHYLGERLNENGLWESQLENEPNPMIILAHELIHAQRVMQGRAIDHIYGSAVYGYLDINKSNDDPQYESAYYEELVTIGLIDFGNQPINENSIRSEHGLNIRSVYSLN